MGWYLWVIFIFYHIFYYLDLSISDKILKSTMKLIKKKLIFQIILLFDKKIKNVKLKQDLMPICCKKFENSKCIRILDKFM